MNGTVPTYPGLADAIVADLCHGTYAKRGLDVFVCTFETGEGTTYFELGLQWVFRENLPCAYIGCFERELCAVDAVARRKAQPNEVFLFVLFYVLPPRRSLLSWLNQCCKNLTVIRYCSTTISRPIRLAKLLNLNHLRPLLGTHQRSATAVLLRLLTAVVAAGAALPAWA